MRHIEYITENLLGVHFPENERRECVGNILKFLQYKKGYLCYYLFFDSGYGNIDIFKYANDYPVLLNDKGFVQLKKEDVTNIDLVIDLLYEYHSASLYINEYPDLDKKYDYEAMRGGNSLFEGYVIRELESDYVVITRDDEVPPWDLDKMGLSGM